MTPDTLPDALSGVAPHVGAWIEINKFNIIEKPKIVAPHVGAWIEIDTRSHPHWRFHVAPHVGAWIEILCAS